MSTFHVTNSGNSREKILFSSLLPQLDRLGKLSPDLTKINSITKMSKKLSAHHQPQFINLILDSWLSEHCAISQLLLCSSKSPKPQFGPPHGKKVPKSY